MNKYRLSELVLDFDLYPRGSVDSHHAGEIGSAIEAGAEMPPLVIDKKSKRIIDGFHRWKAYRHIYSEDHEVDCIEKTYKNEGEMLLDAMRYNSAHGRALTQHDKAHCLIIAKKFKLSDVLVASALNLTMNRVTGLRANKIAKIGRYQVALKNTIKHKAGHQLTSEQAAANEKLSGMNQLFYVNQLVTLIDNDLIDSGNPDLLSGMERLRGLLERFLVKAA